MKYADIVLPAAHWFEQQELVPISATQCFLHSEKAIDPLYESKSDFEILKLLAAGMGHPDLIDLSEDEYMSQVVDTPGLGALGITYDAIKENEDMYWYADKPWIPWKNAEFRTESGRMEFYVENPTVQFDVGQEFDEDREHLPRYFNPTEAYEGSPTWDKYKLILLSERPRFRVHSMWSDNAYLRELDPEPTSQDQPRRMPRTAVLPSGDLRRGLQRPRPLRGPCGASCDESIRARVHRVYTQGLAARISVCGRRLARSCLSRRRSPYPVGCYTSAISTVVGRGSVSGVRRSHG